MAKLLLFFVICFFSVSLVQAQCDKTFYLNLNGTGVWYSASVADPYRKYSLCKDYLAEFAVSTGDSKNLKFKWFRNDTLLTETLYSIKTSKAGLYRVEIKDDNCVYEIKTVELEFVENIQINTAREITICENIGSPYSINTETNPYLQPITYQWQRNGIDIVGATNSSINPKNAGTYTIRATAGNCSATSAPIDVKASPDNILQSYIALDNSNYSPLLGDTLFLCDDNTYNLTALNTTDWYFNGNFIGNDYKVPLKESGTYYTSQKFVGNCIIRSNPIYISLGKKISPLIIPPLSNAISCDAKFLHFYNGSFRGNNRLVFYDFKTDAIRAQFFNVRNSFTNWMYAEDYKVQLEAGSCKSDPVHLDFTNRTVQLQSNARSARGEKIALCNNEAISLSVSHNIEDEVSLYKDGKAIKTKLSSTREFVNFSVSETGKYYIKITSPYCDPITPIFSDTLEVDIAEPISTILTQDKKNCSLENLKAADYAGYSYRWYKNDALLPDETSSNLFLNSKGPGLYYAVLQKDLCSVATQTVTFIDSKEKIIATQFKGSERKSISSSVCEGYNLFLVSSLPYATYEWKGPNGFTSKEPSITIENISSQHSGWYFLHTTKDGCTLTDSINIQIKLKSEFSIRFLTPICADKDLIVEASGALGTYKTSYNLFGSLIGQKAFTINSKDAKVYLNHGKIVKPFQYNSDNFLIFHSQTQACSFNVDIPPINSSEDCNDALTFTNLKEKYCYETKTTLTFNIPKSVPANTKFKLSIENLNSNFSLGTTTKNTVEVQMPGFSLHNAYFIIESEDGKYKAISKEVNIIGSQKPFIVAFNGSNSTSSVGGTHCEGYATKIAIPYPRGQSYQWKKDGFDIVGATKKEFDAKESGNYTIAVTELGCVAESNSLVIKSGSIPGAAIKSITGFASICQGFGAPIIETGGFGYDKYVWKYNGSIVAEKTTNEAFEARETGYYLLEASQGTCKKITDSIYVNVSELSKNLISVFTTTPEKGKVYVCDTIDTYFYNRSFNIYNRNNEDIIQFFKRYGLNFQWKHNSMDIPNAINPYTITSNKPGKYILQVKQGECVVNSNEIEVVQQEKPSVKLLSSSYGSYDEVKNSISVCVGDSLTLYPYSKVFVNDWDKELYKDGKLIESRTKLDGNNFYSYFPIYESGAYYLKVSSSLQKNCSSISDTIHIEVANKTVTLPVDTFAVCKNVIYTSYFMEADSFQLIYNNKVISHDSNLILDQPGLYVLEGKRNNGCIIKKPYLKENKIKPYVTSNRFYSLPFPDPVVSCKGLQVNLAIAGIHGSYTFEWYNNEQKLLYTDYSINVNESGNYYAKVKYGDCEATTNAIKVDFMEIKNEISPAVDSLGICINGSFQTLEVSKDTGYTYEWFKDNVGIEETSAILKATQTGTYKALIQSGDCSALTTKVKIYTSTQLPTATISGDTTLNMGDTANLKLSFTSSPPFTYKLSNNQDGTSEKSTIVHPVKIEEATIFKLASIKNACGEGTVSGEAKVQVIILANEPLIGHKITIAPVPAESYCEIIFDLPTSQTVSYQLLDMKGQQLSEKNLGNVTYKKQYLNLSQLTEGEYLIRIQVGKDFVTRKLIKF
jgi:hypothetical protein